jgi:hypothetical protein
MLWKKSAGFYVWQMGRASSISEQPESIFFYAHSGRPALMSSVDSRENKGCLNLLKTALVL